MKWTEKIISFTTLLFASVSFAQKPREIQVDNAPPYWEDPAVIIALIAIPIILIIFGVVYYQRRKRKIKKIKDRLNQED